MSDAAPQQPSRHQTIDVLSLVFAVVVPLVGLILALVSRSNARRERRRPDGLTTAALAVSTVLLSLGVLAGIAVVVFTLTVTSQTTAALDGLRAAGDSHASDSAPAASTTTVTVSVTTNDASPPVAAAAKAVLEARLHDAGVDYVAVHGTADAGYRVEFPDTVSSRTTRAVTRALQPDTSLDGFSPVLFVSADTSDDPAPAATTYESATCDGRGPRTVEDGDVVVCDRAATPDKYLLGGTPTIPLTDIASVQPDGTGSVSIALDADGAAALRALSASLVQNSVPQDQLAIVAGGRVLLAPTVNTVVGNGLLQITGDDADEMVAELEFARNSGTFSVQ